MVYSNVESNITILLRSIKIPGEDKTLTRNEEIALGEIVQNPETSDSDRRSAINTLVIKNIYLVLKLVPKYKRASFDLDDLVGYGILGLFSAARKYNPTSKNRFASYARHWIKESIMKAVREYNGTPKIPVYLVKNLWHVTRILSKNDTISDSKLAELAELDLPTVIHLRSLLFKTVQFDPAYTEIDSRTPENVFLQNEQDRIFQHVLDTDLTENERIVLSYSCELCGCPKMTFSAIESKFGIKNASRLKAAAIDKLSNDPQLRALYKGC